jgi:hypothetical protein
MDIATQKPVSGKASAGGKGHVGAALATVFMREDEAKIRSDLKATDSLKARLRRLAKLSEPDHIEFRATMEARRDELKAQAKAAGFDKWTEWFTKGGEEGLVGRSLNTGLSLWQRLSTACQKGTTWIDYELSWGALTAKATEFNNAQGASSGQGQNNPKKAGVLDKAKSFVKATMQDENGKIKAELITPQDVKIGDKTVTQIPLVESLMMMLSMADPEDSVLDELVAKVQQFKKDRHDMRAKAAEATAQAQAAARKTTTEKKAIQNRSATGSPGKDLTERAMAIVKESAGKPRARRTVRA